MSTPEERGPFRVRLPLGKNPEELVDVRVVTEEQRNTAGTWGEPVLYVRAPTDECVLLFGRWLIDAVNAARDAHKEYEDAH